MQTIEIFLFSITNAHLCIDNKRLVSYEGGQSLQKSLIALIKATATKPTQARLAKTSKCLMLAGRLQVLIAQID